MMSFRFVVRCLIAPTAFVLLGCGSSFQHQSRPPVFNLKPDPAGSAAIILEPKRNAQTDLLGDPLPRFALARCGTTRHRPGSFSGKIAFTPDGTLLAASDYEGITFSIPRTGREVRRLESEGFASFEQFAFASDGRSVAVAAAPGVAILNFATGNLQQSVANASTFALSPRGRLIAVAGSDQRVCVFDVGTGVRMFTTRRFGGYIRGIYFNRDGSLMAISDYDDSFSILDTSTGETRYKRRFDIHGLDFSPDGRRFVASGVRNRRERSALWDVATGRILTEFKATCAAFNPRTGMLAYAVLDDSRGTSWRSVVHLMNVETGRSRPIPETFVRGRISKISFSPTGELMAYAGADDAVRVFDLTAGKLLPLAPGHTKGIYALDISPDGRRIITGSSDGTARVWQADSGVQLAIGEQLEFGVHGVAFQGDESALFFGDNGTEYRLMQVDPSSKVAGLKVRGTRGGLGDVVFSQDRSRMAYRAYGKPIRVIDTDTGKPLAQFGRSRDELAMSPDGSLVASAYGYGDTISIWSVRKAKKIKRLKFNLPKSREIEGFSEGMGPIAAVENSQNFVSLTFSSDGKQLVSGHGNGLIMVWDLEGETSPQPLFGQGWQSVQALSFSPDRKILAVGDYSGSICLWDFAEGRLLTRLPGHRYAISCLAFSRDGKTLVSGSDDTTALVWDVEGALVAAAEERRNFDETQATAAMLESIFRSKIRDAIAKGRKATYFLSSGNRDAPDSVIAKLSDLPVKIRKASQLARADQDGVSHKKSGNTVEFHDAVVIRWLGPNDAIVQYSRNMAPLGGGGDALLMSRRNGRWRQIGSWMHGAARGRIQP